MDNNAGIIAITTITLLFISAAELGLQYILCRTNKHYLISLFIIIIINTGFIAFALGLTFDPDVGAVAIWYVSASMVFPICYGLMRMADIKADDELKWDAQGFLKRRKNNAR